MRAMPDTPSIDIQPEHWAIVRDILLRHVPLHAVWAFGSRVKGTARRYSDLDLAVIASAPLPLAVQAAMQEAFSESDLPWRVDIVDYAATGEAFRQVIRRDGIQVLPTGAATPPPPAPSGPLQAERRSGR